MKILRMTCYICMFVFVLGFSTANSDKQKTKHSTDTIKPLMVRVAIVRDAREFDLAIEGEYLLRNLDTKEVLLRGKKLVKTHVRLLDKGLFLGINVYSAKRFLVEPLRNSSVIINNRRFRGEIAIILTINNRMTVVNRINIEDYVKGVLYHEVSHHWPMEALKTQAVATRSYAIYKLGYSQKSDFDMTNDIYSQVYGGQDSERYRTGLAVDYTKNLVLSFKGKILPTYFHATCAGMTEDASELWNIDLPSLKGVACTFCQSSPHMKWKRNFRLKDLQDLLIHSGRPIGLIKNIEIIEKSRSLRVKNIKITSREGEHLFISGKDFRELIGPNTLRSNIYEIEMKGYFVDFIGKGWGHGVGLCQWGAKGMADAQFNFKHILAYYYPHSEIVDYNTITNFSQPAATALPKK